MTVSNLFDYVVFLCSKRKHERTVFAESPEDFVMQVSRILEEVIDEMESGSKEFIELGENGLSNVLVIGINGRGVRGSRETNSNGHVDITITSDSRTSNRILGEAKIYKYPSYHVGGMTQLLSRYSTGRFRAGFVIEYVKIPEIANIVKTLRTHVDEELPLNQLGPSEEHPIRWAFQTKHTHSSGEVYEVLHLACNLASGRVDI